MPTNLERYMKAESMGASSEALAALRKRYKLEDADIEREQRIASAGHAMPYLAPIAQGVTAGFSDEIMGGIRSLAEWRPYAETVAEEREAMRRAYEAPGSTVAEIGGAMLLPSRAFMAAAPIGRGAVSAGQAAKAGAAAGGAYGSLYGAGTAENLADVPADAAIGGVIGGLGGAIAGPLATGAGNIARRVVGRGSEGGRAIVQRALGRDQMTPEQLATRLETAQRRAPEGLRPMAADVAGPEVQSLVTHGVMQIPGRGRTQMASEIARSQRQAGRVASRAIDDLLGTAGANSADDIPRLAADRAARDAVDYDVVRAFDIGSLPENARSMIDTAFDKAIKTQQGGAAYREALNNLKLRYQMPADIPADEVAARIPYMERLHEFQSILAERARRAVMRGQRRVTGPMNDLRQGVLRTVDRALDMARRSNPDVPNYRAIREATRMDHEYEEAMKAGYSLVNKGASQVASAVKAAKGPDLEALRIGYATKLREQFAKSPNAASRIKYLTSDNTKRELAALGLSRGEVRRFLGELGLMERRRMLALASGNSATALRQAVREDLTQGVSGAQSVLEETGRELAQVRMPGAGTLGNIIMRNLPRVQERVLPRRGEAIADILRETNPSRLRAALQRPPGRAPGEADVRALMAPIGASSAIVSNVQRARGRR